MVSAPTLQTLQTRECSRYNFLFSYVEAWKLYSPQNRESKFMTLVWLVWNWICALTLLTFLGISIPQVEWWVITDVCVQWGWMRADLRQGFDVDSDTPSSQGCIESLWYCQTWIVYKIYCKMAQNKVKYHKIIAKTNPILAQVPNIKSKYIWCKGCLIDRSASWTATRSMILSLKHKWL